MERVDIGMLTSLLADDGASNDIFKTSLILQVINLKLLIVLKKTPVNKLTCPIRPFLCKFFVISFLRKYFRFVGVLVLRISYS